MEKLRAKDAARGDKPGRKMNEADKDRIAEIRRYCESKLAEREILFKSEREKAMHDPDKLKETEDGYQIDRRRFESDRDEKIKKIRG